RHGEGRREAGLAVVEQVAEAFVRLGGGPEPGKLPHRPELPAIHRGIDAARERIDAGIREVALVVDRDVVRRVERLVLEPGNRGEELALALGLRLVELALPRLRGLQPVLGCRHSSRDSTKEWISWHPPLRPILAS